MGQRILTVPGEKGAPMEVDGKIPICDVKLRRGYIVEIRPGDGCESAFLGLCQYPRRVRFRGVLYRPDFAAGRAFRSSCKTQYAHKHGWENFLRCHKTVLRLLEFLRGLGMGVDVDDEGGYWGMHSEEKLRSVLKAYDGLLACVAGAMKDAAEDSGGGHRIESPIFARKDFERLEAEGLREIGRPSA